MLDRPDIAPGRRLAIVNGHIVDPASGLDGPGGVLVLNGIVEACGPQVTRAGLPSDAVIVDAAGCIVAPGLIDMRAFVGEPGAEHRETLKTASEAAAAGGVTTLVCMPDTDPVIDEPAIVDFVMRRARDTAIVRVLPAAALTKHLAGQEMTEFGLLKEAGAIAVTDGARSVRSALVMRRALTYARDTGTLIMHHVEDPDLAAGGVINEGELSSRLGLPGVPVEAELIMLERDLRLVALTGARYHAAMISCARSVDLIRAAKASGLPVSAGVSINSLTLNENDIGEYRTFVKLKPPLRGEDERLALVRAVASGDIDVIVSDHNPQDVETKRLPFAEAADGSIGVETMLSAGLRLVHAGEIGLSRLIEAMSARPAQLLSLPTGSLTPGSPADLITLDPDEPYVVDKAELKSRAKNTAFDGARMQGRVRKTFVAGRLVHG